MNPNLIHLLVAIVGILFALANYSITTVIGAEILARSDRILKKLLLKFGLFGCGVIILLNLSQIDVVVALGFYFLTLLLIAIRASRRANSP